MGLVCGFVLTQQQAAAAATNAPDPTATSMVAPQSTLTAKSAEPNQKEQPVNQQTSTQKSVTSTDTVSETANQNRISGTQSIGSSATTTAAQPATASNNPTTSAPKQQETAAQNPAATSSANSFNEATQPVSQPTVPMAPQANKATNSAKAASTTADPQQVETIAQGTWGTSKWEYTHQGDDYILHFHEGTFGNSSHKTIQDPLDNYQMHYLGSIGASPEIFNGNWHWNEELTQIVIDPGVIANQDSSYLFSELYKLQQIVGLANLDTANVTNISYMFESYQGASLDLSHFDTSNVTDMSGMFAGYQGPQLDFSHLNTANVTDMSQMFADYQGSQLDFSYLNTDNVTNMTGMFSEYKGPQLDFSHFNTTNVTDMHEMFEGCDLTSLDLSHFNTINVTNMYGMFWMCHNLTNLDLSHFNTDNVTDMSCMFRDCFSLNNVNVNNFKFNNTDLNGMFQECHSLTNLDLSNWDTTSLDENQFGDLFLGAIHLNHLVLGAKTVIGTNSATLQGVPNVGTRVPGTDRVVASRYWVATSGYQQGHKYTSNDLMELTGRDQVTTYDWDSKPAFTQTTETKGVTRAIRIHQLDGNTKTEIQSVMISRPVTLNADGSKTYGAWSTAQWDAYAIPEIAGYAASVNQIPAQTVDSNTTNQTIDVYYEPQEQTVEIQYLDHGQIVGTQKITGYTGDTIMPNYHAPQGYEITSITPATITIDGSGKQIVQVNVSHKQETSVEYKTVIRTINLHQINGQMKTYKQTVLLQRGVQRDAVTGNKTYGQWNTGYWDAFNIPVIDGYTASQDQVAAQLVTDQDSDQTVDVYYTHKN